ncbi:MAG: 4-hydroxy-tetrahydrodipicolinate synthase [Ottowia sp.]|nr:4-hydroxy-tetrahydrodipicolinate synthase [Ottowia sp.]
MTSTYIHGSIVALVTPMHEDGQIDYDSLRSLIDWHIDQGTDGIVIVGTTGESATVSVDEHCELIRAAALHVAGRIPLIAGAGANSTAEAIALTRYAKQSGAVASLQVVPYYNRPTQEGMYQHFRAIAQAVDFPMILYNVPGRTVADMANETVLRLAQIPGIVGIKDATGNVDRGMNLIHAVPKGFAVYSGDDATAVALMLMGGQGNISVTANVAPHMMHALCVAAMSGNVAQAKQLHFQMIALHKQLFIEPNPIPVKWALQTMGHIAAGLRLPLTPLAELAQPLVRAALVQAGVLV